MIRTKKKTNICIFVLVMAVASIGSSPSLEAQYTCRTYMADYCHCSAVMTYHWWAMVCPFDFCIETVFYCSNGNSHICTGCWYLFHGNYGCRERCV